MDTNQFLLALTLQMSAVLVRSPIRWIPQFLPTLPLASRPFPASVAAVYLLHVCSYVSIHLSVPLYRGKGRGIPAKGQVSMQWISCPNPRPYINKTCNIHFTVLIQPYTYFEAFILGFSRFFLTVSYYQVSFRLQLLIHLRSHTMP